MTSKPEFAAGSQKVLESITGVWACAGLAAAVSLKLFTRIEEGANSIPLLSEATGAPERTLAALLSVLADRGYLSQQDGIFANSPEAKAVLVVGKPEYLGEFVLHNVRVFPEWSTLPQIVATGVPAIRLRDVINHPFWESIGQAALPLGIPFAQAVSQILGIPEAGAIKVLDVAGGTGYFCCAWLKDNPQALATQLDWENMNALARQLADSWGVSDRLSTRACNAMEEADLGVGAWDYIIYAQMAHGVSWARNVAVFQRAWRALAPGGALVVTDYLRTENSPPFVALMDLNILVHSSDGRVWSEVDCRAMLSESGFHNVSVQGVTGPNTLILARK